MAPIIFLWIEQWSREIQQAIQWPFQQASPFSDWIRWDSWESRYYATKLADIRQGRESIPKYAEKIIPIIPDEYTDYKQNM